MCELFRFELRRRRFGSRTRKNGSMKKGCGCGNSGVAFVKHCEHVFGSLIEHFLEVCHFLPMIPSFGVLERNEVLSNVR